MNAQQLKNAILQEAIEGRLVPQDPNDEPASVLLARIRKEKERLVKAGKLKKKDLEVEPITEDEIPFEIPDSWEWVRLKSLVSVLGDGIHGTPEYDITGGYYFINGNNLSNNKIVIKADTKKVNEKEYQTYKKELNDKTILVSINGTIGNVGHYNNEPVILGKSACYYNLLDISLKSYITMLMYTDYFLKYAVENATGSTIKNVSLAVMNDFLVPFPPVAEQHRIVAKIEELLPKVEEYGKAQETLDKLNEELPERLKKSILQEAIEGRLVPQDPNDEPASVLLDKIRKEKEQLIKEGKLKKKDVIETPISDDEIPFDIPDSWEWARLGDVGLFERGNGIKRDETFKSGYPCVRYGEMYTKYKYAPTFEITVSFTSKSVYEKCRKAHKGDLFMALTGENKQDISLAAQYIGDEEIAVGGDLCHFTILEAYGLYFVYLINSTYFSSKKELLASGDIIVHISTDKLASIPIPLPPLAEQKRIVTKIEELLKEIGKL